MRAKRNRNATETQQKRKLSQVWHILWKCYPCNYNNTVSMSGGFYGSNDSKLSSKAGALEFAVAINTTSDGNGRAVVDYDEAQKLFDFICKNVKLSEIGRDSMETLSEGYANLLDTLVKELGSRKVVEKEVSKA